MQWQGDAWQASHNYLALDFPGDFPDAPLTNGHLHRAVLGYAEKLAISSLEKTNSLHWSLLPTMAVSSNQIKNPETIELESFRSIEDIDAPLLQESRATIDDGYLNMVNYTTEINYLGGVYETEYNLTRQSRNQKEKVGGPLLMFHQTSEV